MAENRFRMRSGPAVWEHFFQARIVCMEAEKQVADIDPRLNAMTLGARQDRVQHGSSWAGCFIAQEQPILAAHARQSHLNSRRNPGEFVPACWY